MDVVWDGAVPERAETDLTIDELSAQSGVPSRTIRFYQSKGVLAHPEKKGRVSYYGPAHVERLGLIAKLQDRGLKIDAIRALVTSIDRGEVDVGEWLGLEAELKASWANDQPRTVTEEELFELAGTRRVGLIAELVRLRAVERKGDVYLVRSPSLLAIAMRLGQAGIELDTAVKAEALLRKHVGRAARELAAMFFHEAQKGHLKPPDDGRWGRLFEELRPTGIEAVRVVFGQEMERTLREMVESGKTAKLPASRKRR